MDAIDKSIEFTESEAEFRRKIWLVLAPLYETTPGGAVDDGLHGQVETKTASTSNRTEDDGETLTHLTEKPPQPASEQLVGVRKEEDQTEKSEAKRGTENRAADKIIQTSTSKHAKVYYPPTKMSKEELSQWRAKERMKRRNEQARNKRAAKNGGKRKMNVNLREATWKPQPVYYPPTEMSKEELSQWRAKEKYKRKMERQREARAAKPRANEEKKRKIENLRKAEGEVDVCLNRLIASPPSYLLQFTAFIHTYVQAEERKTRKIECQLEIREYNSVAAAASGRPSAEHV
eukprot:scaffold1261_cov50-Cyclotella_meneghiniana.AAC.12